MINFTIPLAPISKKNSQRIFRPKGQNRIVVAPSEAYKKYEAAAAAFIPRNVHINEPVNIKCLFYMPTRRKCDLTNLLEAIDDVLVKTGLLADDNFSVVQSHDGSRVYYDKDNPRTEIYISNDKILDDILNVGIYRLADRLKKYSVLVGDEFYITIEQTEFDKIVEELKGD